MEFPGDPVVRTRQFHYRGQGSIPAQGTKIPQAAWHGKKKSLQIINAGEGVEKREPSSTVGGNVNWCSHYGEQYGHSLNN